MSNRKNRSAQELRMKKNNHPNEPYGIHIEMLKQVCACMFSCWYHFESVHKTYEWFIFTFDLFVRPFRMSYILNETFCVASISSMLHSSLLLLLFVLFEALQWNRLPFFRYIYSLLRFFFLCLPLALSLSSLALSSLASIFDTHAFVPYILFNIGTAKRTTNIR